MSLYALDEKTGKPDTVKGVRGSVKFTQSAGTIAAVTKDDANDLPGGVCMSLWVGGAGNVAIVAENDASNAGTVIVAVPAGTMLPIRARRILSAGTTATSIVALY